MIYANLSQRGDHSIKSNTNKLPQDSPRVNKIPVKSQKNKVKTMWCKAVLKKLMFWRKNG